MKKNQNPSSNHQSANEYLLSFTYHELLALNKLLGRVNGEATLGAEDLHMFTMSPLVASANKKIHEAFILGFRKDLEKRNIKKLPSEIGDRLDSDNVFRLTKKYGPLIAAEKRFQLIDEESKQYIRKLEGQKLREYCELYYAPFIPTEAHIEELIGILKAL